MHFVELRCPNTPRQNSQIECRREMGGPSIESLKVHNWDKPFVDCRYCPSCGVFWEVTIKGMRSMPYFKIIPDGTKINLVRIHDVFPLTTVQGRKVLK